MNRLLLSSLVSVPVSIAHILFFSMNLSTSTTVELTWRSGVILSHTVLAVVMSMLGGLALLLKKQAHFIKLSNIIPFLTVVTIITAGIVLVTFDQLVTSSITPFLICSIIVGVVFLLKPLISALVYCISFVSYFFAISITQTDPAILLSNRVNGLTAVGLGFFLSVLLWRTSLSNLQQKQTISEQEIELVQKNHELEMLAYYDQTTGVYNRRKFDELLIREISMMKRYEYPSCIIVLDIDRFKEMNDVYGHPVGDTILEKLATVLSSHIRESDVLSRWGGDEFLLLLSHTSIAEGRIVAENLRQVIEEMAIPLKDAEIKITASFGVGALHASEENPYERAYIEADSALYQAKKKGKNRVEVFSESLDEPM